MNRTIGILGCGWLGTPLARRLIAAGYTVRGSTTRAGKLSELQSYGIEAHRIELTQSGFADDPSDFLRDLKCLVFNIPPGVRSDPNSDFPARVRHLLRALDRTGNPRLVFVSSTSVYGRGQGIVDETIEPVPETESGRQLAEAEEMVLASASGRQALILRFGGLIGPDRHPVSFLSGRKDLSGGSDPVNLIHLEDCLGILLKAVSDPELTGLANAVAPGHPTKREYYQKEARLRGIPAPQYREREKAGSGKIIKSRVFLINNHNFQTTLQA